MKKVANDLGLGGHTGFEWAERGGNLCQVGECEDKQLAEEKCFRKTISSCLVIAAVLTLKITLRAC